MNLFEALFKYPLEKYRSAEGLVFRSGIRLEILLAALVLLSVAAWWLYRRVSGRISRRSRAWTLAARLAFLAILFFILAIPALKIKEPSKAVFTAVVVDTSRSMTIEDVERADGKRSRMDAAREVLLGAGGRGGLIGNEELAKVSETILYGFDTKLRRISSRGELAAKGTDTDIYGAFKSMDEELRAIPLSAVVFLSDGCRTAGLPVRQAAGFLERRGVPVFVVGTGSEVVRGDYQILKVLAPRRVRRNAEVEIDVVVGHGGFDDKPFELLIRHNDKDAIDEALRIMPQRAGIERVRARFVPTEGGTYEVIIRPGPGVEAPGDRPENNRFAFELGIRRDRLPVLYMEGSPRYEYRFLREAMERDQDFRLVGLLRLGKKRGATDDQNKDLYLVQGASEEELGFLLDGFPQTREQLFKFQAVILGDIEAANFSEQQGKLLKEFVADRGGGLMMLGGVNSFGRGGYAGTPIGDMLPVEISASDPPYSDAEYRAEVTPEGLKHPIMRIDPDSEAENLRMWKEAPPVIGITPVGKPKPLATVIMRQAETHLPVLVAQQYGQGRVVAFTSGGSWYWRMSVRSEVKFHEKFWKQVIRWTAVGARERLRVQMSKDHRYGPGEKAYIAVTVLGKDYRPVRGARVTAVIDQEGARPRDLMLYPSAEEGVYRAEFDPGGNGFYKVTIKAEGPGLEGMEPVESFYEVSEPVTEYRDAGLKGEALRKDLAEATGGAFYSTADAPERTTAALVEELVKRAKEARKEDRKVELMEIWDMPMLFILLLGLFALEWIVRRRSGLA